MFLKEIEMDLPYEKNVFDIEQLQLRERIDYDNAVKLYYDLYWKKKRREFQLSTRCMTSMIERLISPIFTEDCWKVLIECVKKPEEKNIKNYLGVYVIQIQFDYNEYILLSDLEKKKIVISKIIEAASAISQKKGLKLEEVQYACKMIKHMGYVNEWIWDRPKKKKDKQVYIKVRHEVDEVTISMVFSDKYENIIKEILITSVEPDERIYSQYLGELKWLSDNEVILITKKGENYKHMI